MKKLEILLPVSKMISISSVDRALMGKEDWLDKGKIQLSRYWNCSSFERCLFI